MLCPQGQGSCDRDHGPGWSWSHGDPGQGRGQHWGVGMGTLLSHPAFAWGQMEQLTDTGEGGKAEGTVRRGLSMVGMEQFNESISTQHFGICPLGHQTSPAASTQG